MAAWIFVYRAGAYVSPVDHSQLVRDPDNGDCGQLYWQPCDGGYLRSGLHFSLYKEQVIAFILAAVVCYFHMSGVEIVEAFFGPGRLCLSWMQFNPRAF